MFTGNVLEEKLKGIKKMNTIYIDIFKLPVENVLVFILCKQKKNI